MEYVKPRLFEIEAWARDGLSEKEMAKLCNVPYSSWREYKKVHKEFEKALKTGKEIWNIKLENAAYRSSLGYTTEEVKHERVWNERENKFEMLLTEKKKKEIPANPAMLKFMMVNRMPDKYKDKQNLEHTGKDGGPIESKSSVDLTKLSDKELEDLEKILSKTSEP